MKLEQNLLKSTFSAHSGEVELELQSVQSLFKRSFSKHLMINSCNLKMYEFVGEGKGSPHMNACH